MFRKISFLLLFFSFFLTGKISAQGTHRSFTGKPQYQIQTKRAGVFLGNINIELFPLIAPKHTNNFDSLVTTQFYDSTAFHRVIPGFMIQGGDPNSKHGPRSTWGMGDPSQPNVPAEFTAATHIRGRLSAARDTGINSANSQFFICVATASWLNGQYSVFGQVTSGMTIVDTIVNAPRDSVDNPYQKIEMFITYTGDNNSIPAVPNLTLPLSGTNVTLQNLLLKWATVPDAILYHVEVSTDSAFSTLFLSKTVATNSVTATNLGYGKYYWRVKTNNGAYLSANSDVWNFKRVTAAPVLVSPANATSGISVNPLFSWNAVSGATSYRLQVADSSSFSLSSMVYDQDSISGTSEQVNGLAAGTQYFWRVRSINGSTEGNYSQTWNFTTTSVSGVNTPVELKDNGAIKCYPNPTLNSALIKYRVDKAGSVQIRIYDATGKEVLVLVNERKDLGEYQAAIGPGLLNPGIYHCVLVSESGKSALKIVIKK